MELLCEIKLGLSSSLNNILNVARKSPNDSVHKQYYQFYSLKLLELSFYLYCAQTGPLLKKTTKNNFVSFEIFLSWTEIKRMTEY